MTMMDPVDPSDLLDGELSPERTQAVEAELAGNPRLQADFAALRDADRLWHNAPATAGFRPKLRLPLGEVRALRGPSGAAIVAIILSLVVLRFVTKTEIPFAWGIAFLIVWR